MQQTSFFDSNDGAIPPLSLSEQKAQLPAEWLELLNDELLTAHWDRVENLLATELAAGQTVFPSTYFSALHLTPLSAVKVVILGQDPYHGEGEAHGLSFSVQEGVKIPPSLRNIFKEQLQSGAIQSAPASGDLTNWAKQGVLLLNTVLSVRKDKAGSHRGHGWEAITDHLIRQIAHQPQAIVFLLWGSDAQKKRALIPAHQLVLEAPHPSPLSSYRGFFGCGHFLKVNEWLAEEGLPTINWQLP